MKITVLLHFVGQIFSKRLPFETDADLGLRSGDDVYLRLKASKDWQLENDFSFHAEQIYRYGIDSKKLFENQYRTYPCSA